MEISNSSHFSSDAYLLSQRKYQAEHDNVLPVEKTHKDQQNDKRQTGKTEVLTSSLASKRSATQTEQNTAALETNPFQAFNASRTRQTNSNHSNAAYKVAAHNSQIGYQAEQAVARYNKVENSQYGQDLVNRIELLV